MLMKRIVLPVIVAAVVVLMVTGPLLAQGGRSGAWESRGGFGLLLLAVFGIFSVLLSKSDFGEALRNLLAGLFMAGMIFMLAGVPAIVLTASEEEARRIWPYFGTAAVVAAYLWHLKSR